ncbi:MAG: T9SS type A sorting domain-containing protein [Owenweeksia sp.]|nr:T9SS type A sorting domain-containing protein [Owenweeksia sp.]
MEAKGLAVYPNPVAQELLIRWPAPELPVQQVSILDMAGQVVVKNPALTDHGEHIRGLDVSRLPTGYIL